MCPWSALYWRCLASLESVIQLSPLGRPGNDMYISHLLNTLLPISCCFKNHQPHVWNLARSHPNQIFLTRKNAQLFWYFGQKGGLNLLSQNNFLSGLFLRPREVSEIWREKLQVLYMVLHYQIERRRKELVFSTNPGSCQNFCNTSAEDCVRDPRVRLTTTESLSATPCPRQPTSSPRRW